MAGIYIHIPFCKSRCIYCDFYSTTCLEWRDAYVENLCREMEERKFFLPSTSYSTIYIGGGTPSQLSPSSIERIITQLYQTFTIDDDAEFTIEMNPDDVTSDYLRAISRLGKVNRISMGVQTFDDQRLRFLHRRHTSAQARKAVAVCRDEGFSNISIDLMFGFPRQTIDEWKSDILQALELDTPHISTYSLMYEPGTLLTRMLEQEQVSEVDEETSLLMYETLRTLLLQSGYQHYEISNFCKPGYHSRHNSNYWNETPYLGLGAGAHSFDGRQRCWNSEMHEARWHIEDKEVLTHIQHYNETVMTRLRTSQGIDLHQFLITFGQTFYDQLLTLATPHIQSGNLAHDTSAGRLRLTPQGIFVSNLVMSDLMLV